jgi:hypothetical protein
MAAFPYNTPIKHVMRLLNNHGTAARFRLREALWPIKSTAGTLCTCILWHLVFFCPSGRPIKAILLIHSLIRCYVWCRFLLHISKNALVRDHRHCTVLYALLYIPSNGGCKFPIVHRLSPASSSIKAKKPLHQSFTCTSPKPSFSASLAITSSPQLITHSLGCPFAPHRPRL